MQTSELSRLLDTPQVAGLRFRRLEDEADYAGMAAVHEGSREWDRVDPLSARESIPSADDLAENFPIASVRHNPDLLIVEVDGRIIGYNHVLWRWTEETGTRVYLHLGYLLPAWRGKGIGRAMLGWAQGRIHEIAADEEASGTSMLATNVSSTEREADALLRNAGYQAVRRLSDMSLEPLSRFPAPALPPTVTLRPVEPAYYPAIYQAWKDAFAGIFTSTPASDEDYQAFLAEKVDVDAFDPALCQVAWIGDEVVGLVWVHLRKGIGTIPEVAVRKAWQRGGIARALMIHALNAMHDRGITQVRLFTDADDGQGARSLYESLGFREVKQHIFYRKPL